MKEIIDAHRVRTAKRRYTNDGKHIFIEIEPSRWVEVETLEGVDYDSIQEFLECERKTGIKIVGFTDQNFQWGTVKDWSHAGVIKDLKSIK